MMNVIEHLLLITAPVRGGQQMSRTISGDTVNYHLRWHMLNTADENVGIFIESQYVKRLLLIIVIEIGICKQMQKLKLHALNGWWAI